ncbi:hypothetical protein F4811DRAFT_84296 [Daldinia bambusicola]|nr:hypothetical protein F4811DRAFT_84296 [Daldinia bambusicola]
MPTLGRHRLGQFDSDEAMDQIYINKVLHPWELIRLGYGGVHLQNIPITENLTSLSTVRDKPAPNYVHSLPFQIKNVHYSASYKYKGNANQPLESLPCAMTLSSIDGCVRSFNAARKLLGHVR